MDEEYLPAPLSAAHERGTPAHGGRQLDQPIEPELERIVDFHGEPLIAFLVRLGERAQIFIPIRSLCDYLGLSYRRERNRILRDDALALVARSVRVAGHSRGGSEDQLSLPLEFLPGWLFTASNVKPELRSKLLRYKLECHQVLWDAFFGSQDRSQQSELLQHQSHNAPHAGSELARIDQIVELLQHMAEGQLAHVERQSQLEMTLHAYKESTESRLDRAAIVVKEMARRLGSVERRLDPDNRITDDQAAVIKAKVTAVALALSEQDPSKNHFQGVYKVLYDQYDISAYSHLRIHQYEQALAFLDTWLEKLLGDRRPDSTSAGS